MNKSEIKEKIERLTEEIEDLQKQLEKAELKPGDVVTANGKRCMVIAPGITEEYFIALRQDGEVVAVWNDVVEQRHGRSDAVAEIIRTLQARDCLNCVHEHTLMIDEPCASCIAMGGEKDEFKRQVKSNDD